MAICFGGITVASKTCSLLFGPSASQSSRSSGVRPMPWLGTAVPFHRSFLEAGDLDAVQHLAGLDVADLEAEQIVDVDEAERLRAVDRERPDGVAERTDAADDLVRLWIGDRQQSAISGRPDRRGGRPGRRRCCARRTWSRAWQSRRRSSRRPRASEVLRTTARRGSCRPATAPSDRSRPRTRGSTPFARSRDRTRRRAWAS